MSDALGPDELVQLRALLAERAITRVMVDYVRGVDQRDHELVRACFFDDAHVDYGVVSGGPDALVEWLEKMQPQVDRMSHQLGPPRIDVDVERGTADAETYCFNVSVLPRDADGAYTRTLSGLRYIDRFERRDGRWRLAERRNVSDWTVRI